MTRNLNGVNLDKTETTKTRGTCNLNICTRICAWFMVINVVLKLMRIGLMVKQLNILTLPTVIYSKYQIYLIVKINGRKLGYQFTLMALNVFYFLFTHQCEQSWYFTTFSESCWCTYTMIRRSKYRAMFCSFPGAIYIKVHSV